MYKTKIGLFIIVTLFININNMWSQEEQKDIQKKYQKCWFKKHKVTLLDTVKRAMSKKVIEKNFIQHNFIQTFGCAYEENDLQQNSIRAVYRAVVQSIRNRNVELRDDLNALLRSNPPRPDNLTREYSIYVNIPVDSIKKAARYEIKILDLVAVPTIESSMSVWTRIVTRFAYKGDYNEIHKISFNESEFIQIMEKAQKILENVERRNFNDIRKMLNMNNLASIYPTRIEDLSFGDSMTLFDEKNMKKIYYGIYLGKGILTFETPRNGMVISKFGEERLFGIRIDTNSFRRTTNQFAELNYEAPEVILQCLFLKYCLQKPQILPQLLVQNLR